MLRFHAIQERPVKTQHLTGCSPEQLQRLTERLRPLWQAAEQHRLSRPNRRRALGAGRPYTLTTLEDKLLLVLVFYRLYLTDELLGWLFGLDASNVCRLRHRLTPLLQQAADPTLGQRLPRASRKIASWAELRQAYPEVAAVITDATEQPRQRPPRRSQHRWYSGKRKRHTVKTQITVTPQGRLVAVSRSYPGRIHDYAIFTRERTAQQLPPASRHYADLGYEGAPGDYPNHTLLVPVKRRRNHRVLTPAERRFNRAHARLRIAVEHVLSQLKKYQVLAQVWRHRLGPYNQVFRAIAALVNFRHGWTEAAVAT
jgi:hypothetical protein